MVARLSKKAFWVAAVGLLALLAACKSPVVSDVTPTPTSVATPTPTTVSTPQELPSLAEALGRGEMLAQGTLAKPNLVYAVKSGKHVTVYMRDITTGQERTLLEYDERLEAQHSGNLWQESVPSASLSPAESKLVYVAENELRLYDIGPAATATILRQSQTTGSGELTRYGWAGDKGAELCCAFGLASPAVSWDGLSAVVSLIQYEGHTMGVISLDGSEACEITDPAGKSPNTLYPVWSEAHGGLLIPSGGAYSADGLFVTAAAEPCTETSIATATASPNDESGFYTAGWSPDGGWVAATSSPWSPEPLGVSLLLVRRDGSERRPLVKEGFSLYPLFSPDGGTIYFVSVAEWPTTEAQVPETLWRYDLENGEANRLVDIPTGWSVRPRGWSSEGYMVLDAFSSSCYYWSCANRVLLVEPDTAGVVYASAASDFTNYLGFPP